MQTLNLSENFHIRVIQNSDPYAVTSMTWLDLTLMDITNISDDMLVIFNPEVVVLPRVYTGGNNRRNRYGKKEPLLRSLYPFSFSQSLSLDQAGNAKHVDTLLFDPNPECISYSHGERLFELEDGKPTPLFKKYLKNVRQCKKEIERTVRNIQLMLNLGLFTPQEILINCIPYATVEVNIEKLHRHYEMFNSDDFNQILLFAEKLNLTVKNSIGQISAESIRFNKVRSDSTH